MRIDYSSIFMAPISAPQQDVGGSLAEPRGVAVQTNATQDRLNEGMKRISLEGVQCSLP